MILFVNMPLFIYLIFPTVEDLAAFHFFATINTVVENILINAHSHFVLSP